MFERQPYNPIRQSSVERPSKDGFDQTETLPCPYCSREVQGRRQHIRQFVTLYLGWISTAILTIAFTITWSAWDARLDRTCLERTSYHSPVLREVPAEYKEIRFNGTLNFPSIYRGAPGPEIDEAWAKVIDLRPANIHISEQNLRDLGVDVDSAVLLPPEAGGSYMLILEFPHQLHCVNLLRKFSYWDYYKDREFSFSAEPDVLHTHIDHCIEMLRQFVMCHADVGVITSHYIEQREKPWPDFNTPHMCRDFDAILEWAVDNQVLDFQPNPPLKPSGTKALAHPP